MRRAGRHGGIDLRGDDVLPGDGWWRRYLYGKADPKDTPTIVLLHGFPPSSPEFDTLIPILATRYHLIAPDFLGTVDVD